MVISASSFAQSGITLYGIISNGFEYVSNEAGSRNVKMFSGALNDSRFGFRVVEDLGSGLSAVATLENGFDVNNGKLKQGGLLFGRQAWIGLNSKRFGMLAFGRQYDVNWDFLTSLVPAVAGIGLGVNVGDNDNTFGTFRYNNSIKYVSPTSNGFKIEGMYAFSNKAGDFSQNRALSAGVGYENGPLKIAATFLNIDKPGAANANGAVTGDYSLAPFQLFHVSPLSNTVGVDRQKVFGAGAAYGLGQLTLSVMASDVRYRYLDKTSLHLDNYDGTLSYLISPYLMLSGGYLYTCGKYGGVSSNASVHWNTGQLSISYFLSKRTTLFAYGDMILASGPRSVAVIFGNAPSSSSSQAIVLAGIRHTF
ncbi:porin [Burkholderia sp. USMB20]|nr:porin [Burkholderia sp. USMB20]